MYAIQEHNVKINGEELRTFIRKVENPNTELIIEAGTTGFTGGCSREKGGRTYLSIDCNRGDFLFNPVLDDDDKVVGIEIACCGDDGMNAIMKALEFIHEVINDQRCEVDD